MALDLHLGRTKGEASQSGRTGVLAEAAHAELFATLDPAEYPFLARLSDPYGDATFRGEEIDSLRADARRHLNSDSASARVTDLLDQITAGCLQARERDLNLFFFAD